MCFDLVAHSSKADYEAASTGWRPRYKMSEMKSPELRYILVREKGDDGGGKIAGFASMMPTFEDGEPVLYCYEIHLCDELLG